MNYRQGQAVINRLWATSSLGIIAGNMTAVQSLTAVTVAGSDLQHADIDSGTAVGDLVHIISGTGVTVGYYRILTVGANQITVDRAPGGAGSDIVLNVWKDVLLIQATDATNGQFIGNFSAQNKPLQIGGHTYVSTTDLTSEDIVFGGEVKFVTNVYIGDSANAKSTLGLTINQAGNDDEILSLKSSDVSHSFTTDTEADTFFYGKKLSATLGGAGIWGLSDGDATGLQLTGGIGIADPTNTVPAVVINGVKLSGTTYGALGNPETVFQVQNNATPLMTVLGSGSTSFINSVFASPIITKGPAAVAAGFVGTVTAAASTTVTFSSAADAILAGYDASNPVLGVTLISNALTRYIVSWTNSTTAEVNTAVTWAGTAITSIQFPEGASIRSNGTLDEAMLANGNKYFVNNVGIGTTGPGTTLDVVGSGRFSSTVGIGANRYAQMGLEIAGAIVSGSVAQGGLESDVTIASDGITSGTGIYSRINTAAAAFTTASTYGVYIANPTKGAGSAITTNYGLYLADQTSGSTNYSIYSAGGTNYFNDNVGINTTTFGTNLAGGLALGNGTAATAALANGFMLWSANEGSRDGYAHPHIMNEAGQTGALAIQAPLVNLLSNSSFGSWSNGTPENVGSQLVASWTNADYDTFTSTAADITSAVYTTAGTQDASSAAITLVSGKLYKIVVTLTLNSGQAPTLAMTNLGHTSAAISAGANTFVREATSTTTTLTVSNTAAANWSATFTLYEVTPGTVAADTLGPDGYTKTIGMQLWREHNGSNTRDGSFYSLKSTFTATNEELRTSFAFGNTQDIQKYSGKTVTIGCWVKTSTSNLVKLGLRDSVGGHTESSYHSGGGAWEWLEVTALFSSDDPTYIYGYLRPPTVGTGAGTAYYSQPMLVFGPSIGAGNYAPSPNEMIYAESVISLTNYTATTSAADGTINLEAQSSGKIPKGVKAVLVKAYGKDSAAGDGVGFDVQSASGVEDGLSLDTQVNNIRVQGQGWIKADANGDIYFDHRGSGASALTIDLKVIAVQP